MTDRELVVSMKPGGCWGRGGEGRVTGGLGGRRVCNGTVGGVKESDPGRSVATLRRTAEEPGRVRGLLLLISLRVEAGAPASAVVSNEIIGARPLLNHGFTRRGRCEVNPGSARLCDGAATSPRR